LESNLQALQEKVISMEKELIRMRDQAAQAKTEPKAAEPKQNCA
jgi:hypothetical protein